MKSNEMAALSIWDMGFFEIESRQRHAQRLSSFHHSSPSHVLYTPPALPHCSQGSPHTPSTHSCPAQPNIYAFTYVLVLYIRSPPAEKKGRNGLANQLGPVLGPFQAREITRLKGSHVYVLHHNPLNVTDGGFLDPPDCAFTPTPPLCVQKQKLSMTRKAAVYVLESRQCKSSLYVAHVGF